MNRLSLIIYSDFNYIYHTKYMYKKHVSFHDRKIRQPSPRIKIEQGKYVRALLAIVRGQGGSVQ